MNDTLASMTRAAEAHLRAGRHAEAIAAYRALLARDDRNPNAWYNLAWLQRQTRDFGAALESYGEALARGVAEAEAVHVNRAAILSEQLHRYAAAETELRQALARNPAFMPAWLNLGNLREDSGDLDAARDAYRAALRVDPANGRAHARLTVLDIHVGELAQAAARLEDARTLRRDPVGEAEFAHAESQLLDARGKYDAAFAAISAANEKARALIDPRLRYDPARQDELIDALIAAFPKRAEEAGVPIRPQPLFVTGMFRSGSTLCETVLARHSRITSGGELELLPALIAGLPGYPAAPFDTELLRYHYRTDLAQLFPGADIVTDKRPDNFLHLGLVAAMFPGTPLVHTVREPADTALSIFFLYFEDSVAYGARLEDIVHYMRGYRRLMRHWDEVLGERIITFDYDAFVAAPEAEARKLFAGLGLEWEEGCLPSPAAAATVRTPSAWAVRQPVHTRSSGRWRNYAKHMAEVKAALDAD